MSMRPPFTYALIKRGDTGDGEQFDILTVDPKHHERRGSVWVNEGPMSEEQAIKRLVEMGRSVPEIQSLFRDARSTFDQQRRSTNA